MNIFSKLKILVCGIIFSFAFSIATTSLGFCCARGLMEEPEAPQSLIKK